MSKSNEITRNDGRKGNSRKKGHLDIKKRASVANQAKKNRMKESGLKAIKKVFGNEQEFWVNLAEQSKDSFNDRKLLMEYVYGKPDANGGSFGGGGKSSAPTINFFGGNFKKGDDENTIDVTPEDE